MQDIPVNLIKHKIFLLALIFALPNSVQTGLQKVGCYTQEEGLMSTAASFPSVRNQGLSNPGKSQTQEGDAC
jgi:hypothetical protein